MNNHSVIDENNKMNKQRLFCFEKKSLKFRLMISEFTGEQDKNQSLQKIS